LRGDKIWWKVDEPNKINRFEVELGLGGYKISTKQKSFIIPVSTKSGLYILKVKAINKSGATATKRILVRVR